MTQPLNIACASLSVVLSLAMGVCEAQAQGLRDSSWQEETESRLKGIYERGEFRPRMFQAEWLPDSSGYTVQERDPKTDKTDEMIRAGYGVRTGERTEPKTSLNEWGAARIDFQRVVADLGYLVVSIDNRGTPAPKGAAWRRAIFGSLVSLSTEEYVPPARFVSRGNCGGAEATAASLQRLVSGNLYANA